MLILLAHRQSYDHAAQRKRLSKAIVSSYAEDYKEDKSLEEYRSLRTTQLTSNAQWGWDVYNDGTELDTTEPLVIDDAVAEDPEAIRAERELLVHSPFTDQELTDITLTSEEVVRMVERGYPALATSAMADFCQSARRHLSTSLPLTIPVREKDPTTWPHTNPSMDTHWGQATDAEKALDPPDQDSTDDFAWLDMSERLLFKSSGSADDSLMVLSSYPTADVNSTVHLAYGTNDDMSSQSMWLLYSKMGFHVADIREHSMFHVDVIPRRLDRKTLPGGDSSLSLLRQLSAGLREYWATAAQAFIRMSKSKILLVVGTVAARANMIYIKENDIEHKVLWTFGKKLFEQEIPLVWLQFEAGKIRRLAFAIPHPKAFSRNRASVLTDIERKFAFREQIFNYCLVQLFSKVHLPWFLSTAGYDYQLNTGSILEMSAFRNFDAKKNDILSDHFKRPTLDTASSDKTLERTSGIDEKQRKATMKVRAANNVKPSDALTYYKRDDVKRKLAGYIITYMLMTSKALGGKASSISKTREKAKDLPVEEVTRRRLRHNNGSIHVWDVKRDLRSGCVFPRAVNNRIRQGAGMRIYFSDRYAEGR